MVAALRDEALDVLDGVDVGWGSGYHCRLQPGGVTVFYDVEGGVG